MGWIGSDIRVEELGWDGMGWVVMRERMEIDMEIECIRKKGKRKGRVDEYVGRTRSRFL